VRDATEHLFLGVRKRNEVFCLSGQTKRETCSTSEKWPIKLQHRVLHLVVRQENITSFLINCRFFI